MKNTLGICTAQEVMFVDFGVSLLISCSTVSTLCCMFLVKFSGSISPFAAQLFQKLTQSRGISQPWYQLTMLFTEGRTTGWRICADIRNIILKVICDISSNIGHTAISPFKTFIIHNILITKLHKPVSIIHPWTRHDHSPSSYRLLLLNIII